MSTHKLMNQFEKKYIDDNFDEDIEDLEHCDNE